MMMGDGGTAFGSGELAADFSSEPLADAVGVLTVVVVAAAGVDDRGAGLGPCREARVDVEVGVASAVTDEVESAAFESICIASFDADADADSPRCVTFAFLSVCVSFNEFESVVSLWRRLLMAG